MEVKSLTARQEMIMIFEQNSLNTCNMVLEIMDKEDFDIWYRLYNDVIACVQLLEKTDEELEQYRYQTIIDNTCPLVETNPDLSKPMEPIILDKLCDRADCRDYHNGCWCRTQLIEPGYDGR